MPRRSPPELPRVEDFGGDFLVVCPRCSACAHVRDRGPDADPLIRLVCPACGHSRELERASAVTAYTSNPRYFAGAVAYGAPVDAYFHLPLWLRAPCCGETLWVYNERHLDYLEAYVGATLRERRQGPYGWSNASLASRLPRWMLSAKNRDEVLHCIRQLRERLPTAETPETPRPSD